MSAFLFRLGRNSARHPLIVIGIWLLVAVAVVGVKAGAGGKFDNSQRVPGVESQHANDVLNARFPSQAGQSWGARPKAWRSWLTRPICGFSSQTNTTDVATIGTMAGR